MDTYTFAVCQRLAAQPWHVRLGAYTYLWLLGLLPTAVYLRIAAGVLATEVSR